MAAKKKTEKRMGRKLGWMKKRKHEREEEKEREEERREGREGRERNGEQKNNMPYKMTWPISSSCAKLDTALSLCGYFLSQMGHKPSLNTGTFLKTASDGQDKDPQGERDVVRMDGRGQEREPKDYRVMAVMKGRKERKTAVAILPQLWFPALAGN